MSLAPKKDGGPNIDFFQSSESMQGFETIRLWLMKNYKKVRVRACGVAILEFCVLAESRRL